MEKRKQFFRHLLVFVILVIALNMIFNLAYNHWMYYFRLSRTQDHQLKTYQGEMKYLFLGNSHNRANPEFLDNGFSYIMPKEVYRQTYYKLKYILQSGKKPENVVLSIDPVNFSPRAEKELPFEGYWKNYLNYCDMVREDHDPSYLVNWASGNFFSYVGNYKYILMSAIFFNADLSVIRNGYIPARNYRNFADEPNRDALGFEIATAYLASFSRHQQLGAVRDYLKIISLCQQHHIHLVLVRMPLTDEYLKYARKMIDMDRIDHEIVELTHQYCPDCTILDYRDYFKGKPQYFFNADHINPEGVRIISEKMKAELKVRS